MNILILPPRVVRCLSWIEVERTINEIAQGGVLKSKSWQHLSPQASLWW